MACGLPSGTGAVGVSRNCQQTVIRARQLLSELQATEKGWSIASKVEMGEVHMKSVTISLPQAQQTLEGGW
jgi:hypothetical protein